MEPEREPLKPTIEQLPERRSAEQTPPVPEDDREEQGWDQPESSAQKAPPPGPLP